VSFYYPKTVETVLTLKKESLMSEEKKTFRIEEDFLKAKENTIKMGNALKEKFDWIKDFRWRGDISFKPNRSKKSVKQDSDAGKEVSFGLDQIMTYIDENGIEKWSPIIMRFKPTPFYDVYFKAMKENPTPADLIEQMKDVWIYLGSGGTPENPKAIILTKLGEYPIECIVNAEGNKGHKGRFKIAFNKWVKWNATNVPNIFGETSDKLFDKIRS
jgi:hypothetical protein